MEDGYIKFKIERIDKKIINDSDIKELNIFRKKLKDMNLVGMKDNGVGFGNISIRYKKGFIITASATGGIKELTSNDYSYVYKHNLNENKIFCKGLKNASSESLSHAVIYEKNKNINSVIHIHSKKLWDKYYNKLPTTDPKASYGTVEIAKDIKNKIEGDEGIIVMGGHEEGIISYSKNLSNAFKKIKKL